MNGFMVTLGTTLDDLPLGLFATEDEATDFARTVDDAYDPKVEAVYDLTSRDKARGNTVAVWEFRDGVPVDYTVVRDVEMEDDEDSEFDSEIEFEDDAAEAFDEADKGMGNDA